MKRRLQLLLALVPLACTPAVHAQPALCASEAAPNPTALIERFVSADCMSCWREADNAAAPPAGTVRLDWVLPTPAGADAPLAPAARRDALERLQMLGLATPQGSSREVLTSLQPSRLHLRVAHGLPVANYIGTAVELSPPDPGPWTAVLLLVEKVKTDPTGNGNERHLVRNMLVTSWSDPRRSVDASLGAWRESRPMNIPESTEIEKLYALAWVHDAQGHTVAMARADCTP